MRLSEISLGKLYIASKEAYGIIKEIGFVFCDKCNQLVEEWKVAITLGEKNYCCNCITICELWPVEDEGCGDYQCEYECDRKLTINKFTNRSCREKR